MSTEGMFSRLNGRLDDSDEVETPLTVSDHILRAQAPLTVSELADELGQPVHGIAKLVGSLSMRGVVAITDGQLKISPLHRTARVSPGGMWGQLSDL